MVLRAGVAAVAVVAVSGAQAPSRDALIAVLRPVLPYPSADADGALPSDNSAQSKWFVIWPADPDDLRVVVRANPLHPDTQAAGAAAMNRIQEAVIAAERKAQAAYDRALDQLRRTGKGSHIDGITLDDEGVAGERIDAELELTIDVEAGARTFEIASSSAPQVTAGERGVTWAVSIPSNVYRDAVDGREHFRASETRLYHGLLERPAVDERDGARFVVSVRPTIQAITVVVRGNEELLARVVAGADWSSLGRSRPK
jgi:hypothetical protein